MAILGRAAKNSLRGTPVKKASWNLKSIVCAMHYTSKDCHGKDSPREGNLFREIILLETVDVFATQRVWQEMAEEHRESDRKWQRNTESSTGNGRGTQRVWQEMAEEHRESDRKWQRNIESLTGNGRGTHRVWQEMAEEHSESDRKWQRNTKSLTGSGRGTQRVWQEMSV